MGGVLRSKEAEEAFPKIISITAEVEPLLRYVSLNDKLGAKNWIHLVVPSEIHCLLPRILSMLLVI